ncbi:delta(14)-sterol reductase TM7SF2 [Pieris brassicae]|uniref:delta(14)-sterol reductase TM7SF2 n=1 Tax=Pieris brassicae TaxID=7116 RepID=UPI001E66242A|nr:delta(14)-sterol reductase TM7SF2 [Pieris brassicae]
MSTRSGRVRASIADTSPSRRRKVASPSRSPARNRKESTERITRQSPRKSPSRKPTLKYPARKSPSRTVKEKDESALKSPAKRAPMQNAEVKLEDFSAKLEVIRSTRSKRIEYTIKDIPIKSIEDDLNGIDSTDFSEYSLRDRRSVDIAPRRSSRLRDFVENVPDIRRSLSKSLSKSISKSIDTYSDDESELLIRRKSISVVRKLSTPVPSTVSLAQVNNKFEFGGVFGAIALMFIIPLIAFGILSSCTKMCYHNIHLDLTEFKNTIWLTVPSLEIILVQNILQAGIHMLPVFGSKQVDGVGKKFCFNALFASIVTQIILFSLNFYKIFNINTILESHLQLGVVSFLIALVLSVFLYLKAINMNENDLNPYGNSKYAIYNFFIGREVYPQIKKFNIKLWTYRVCNITTLTLLVLILKESFYVEVKNLENISLTNYQEILSKVQYRPTLAVFTLMQIMYALYFVICEYKVISTFYWQYEGLGYMQLTATALYPFYFTSISKYVADSGLSLRTNTLIAATALFLFGFVFMYMSNDIKYRFRKNPLDPTTVHLDSMPTFHGKKILLSNLWGFVRHPNYLGDIIMHLALALPGILSSRPVAALPALLPIVVLIHRAWRDHCRCRRRYGAAWQRYCNRVPSLLLPKIL